MNRVLHSQNSSFGISLIRVKRDLHSFRQVLLGLSPVQTDATFLANNSQQCWILHVASVCTLCCMLLRRVSKRSNFCAALSTWGHARVVHMVSFEITKSYGLYSSHNAMQVLTLLGVVASVCRPLPTRTQHLPTLLAQQCWELLCADEHYLCHM